MSNIEKAILIANNKELTNKVIALEAKLAQMGTRVQLVATARAVALEAAATMRVMSHYHMRNTSL